MAGVVETFCDDDRPFGQWGQAGGFTTRSGLRRRVLRERGAGETHHADSGDRNGASNDDAPAIDPAILQRHRSNSPGARAP
jgi:hypothetical protein